MTKLKGILVLVLLLSNVRGIAQIKSFKISGIVHDVDSAKFAYLTTLSQQQTISSDKVFMVVPIVDGKFQFTGSLDLEQKKYQYACVFLDVRGNISKEETLSKFRRLIWITGKTKNIKKIIMEDLHLDITGYSKVIDAKVLAGGKLTKQSDETSLAIRQRRLIDVIKKYPDSPVSFDQVSTVTSLTDQFNKDKSASLYGTPDELFEQLSLKQRTSKEGIALKKKIDAKKKHQ